MGKARGLITSSEEPRTSLPLRENMTGHAPRVSTCACRGLRHGPVLGCLPRPALPPQSAAWGLSDDYKTPFVRLVSDSDI